MNDLRGLLPPMVTPMREGLIDHDSISSLVESVVEHVNGLCICSSTGEAASLSLDERKGVVDTYLTAVAGRQPVIVGLSDNAIPDTSDFVKFCEGLAVAAYLVPLPYYFRHTASSVRDYFRWIAGITAKPIVVYDNPYTTKTVLPSALLAKLVEEVPSIQYVKLTDTDINKPLELGDLSAVKLLAGSDDVMEHQVRRGCIGAICATPQVFSAECRHWFDSLISGDERAAFRAKLAFWPFLSEVMVGVDEYPALIKHALWKKHVIASPEVRRPLQPLSELRMEEVSLSLELSREVVA